MQRDRVAPLRAAPRVAEPAKGTVEVSRDRWSNALGRSQSLGRVGKVALIFAIVSGLITHGYHLFDYPLYNTDEGIYVERAWSLIRESRLGELSRDELAEVIEDAWLSRASKRRAARWLAERPTA